MLGSIVDAHSAEKKSGIHEGVNCGAPAGFAFNTLRYMSRECANVIK